MTAAKRRRGVPTTKKRPPAKRALQVAAPTVITPARECFAIYGFEFTPTGVEVHGSPDWAEYVGAFEFAKRAHRCSGWWLADLLRHGETKREWRERLSQLHDATGLSEKTLMNVRAIAKIEKSRRRENVEFATHGAVTALPPAEQTEWLDRAETEGLGYRELRAHIKAAKRTQILDGQAVLSGMYRVIYAPSVPWDWYDPDAMGLEKVYPLMSIADLCALPVQAHALPNSVLFLGVPAPILWMHPGPREVMHAWGFAPKDNLVWDKVLGTSGQYFTRRHELLMVGTRGSCLPDFPSPMPDSVLTERKSDIYGEWPASVRAMIERLWTRGPYLELFASARASERWDTFGNDPRLWGGG